MPGAAALRYFMQSPARVYARPLATAIFAAQQQNYRFSDMPDYFIAAEKRRANFCVKRI